MEGFGEVAGWTALGGFLTVAVTNLLRVWRMKSGVQRVDRKDAIDEWRELLAQREEHAERLESVIRQDQEAIKALQADNADCREESAELRSSQHFLYDLVKRCFSSLKAAGHDPGELPDLPAMRPHRSRESDFLVRQAAASAQLSREAGDSLSQPSQPPPPTPPTPRQA